MDDLTQRGSPIDRRIRHRGKYSAEGYCDVRDLEGARLQVVGLLAMEARARQVRGN